MRERNRNRSRSCAHETITVLALSLVEFSKTVCGQRRSDEGLELGNCYKIYGNISLIINNEIFIY